MDLNITIGQYVKGDSWIYKLDPRLKIISVIVLMIALFLLPTIYHMLVALAILFVIVITARLPLLFILKGLRPIIFISMFSFILQLIYTQEGNLLHTFTLNVSYYHIAIAVGMILFFIFTRRFIPFKLIYFLLTIIGVFFVFNLVEFSSGVITTYDFNIYSTGLINGSFFVTRIIAVLMLTTLLTITTSTIDLNTGLERVLRPFKFILPVSEISLMISLTLRFIPTLLIETNKILKAQASRGVDFSEGSLMQKIKQIITLLIPMFVVSFKRADELACAMEARGYVIGEKRSSLTVLKFKIADYFGFLLIFSALAYTIVLQVI